MAAIVSHCVREHSFRDTGIFFFFFLGVPLNGYGLSSPLSRKLLVDGDQSCVLFGFLLCITVLCYLLRQRYFLRDARLLGSHSQSIQCRQRNVVPDIQAIHSASSAL